jgi:DNA-binding MarR family transcriptional regulator
MAVTKQAPGGEAVTNPYLLYAEFRIASHRTRQESETFRYFRQTIHHSVLWMIIMRGYYRGELPSVKQCIAEVKVSKDTARKIILNATARGYLEIGTAADDGRRKQVRPTRKCIREFEAMVDSYWRWTHAV